MDTLTVGHIVTCMVIRYIIKCIRNVDIIGYNPVTFYKYINITN